MVSKWRSSGSRISVMALAVAALALPADVPAAGLGRLTVLSNLGEPLRAEVDVDATKEELASLSAHLASPAVFRKAGVDYAPILSSVKVGIVPGADGKSKLTLSTDRPVPDPFLDLLVEINWAAGRLVREYTFLLDPADEAVSRSPVAPLAVSRVEGNGPSRITIHSPAEPRAEKKPQAKPETAAKSEVAPKPAPPAASSAKTHTVKHGDTAAKIAQQNLPEGVSLEQMLVAIVRGNPDAFDHGNVNRLRAGTILNLPDSAAASAITAEEARKTLVAQSADFSGYRRKLASQVAGAPAPADEGAKQGASGKVTAKVEEKAPVAAKGGDQLKVSRTDEPRAGGAAGREEGSVAKDRALKDANSRVAELEKNVKDLQQLLEMKNQSLANAAKPGAAQAASQPATPPKPAAPAAPSASMAASASAAVASASTGASVPPPAAAPVASASATASAPAASAPAASAPAAQPPKPPAKKPVLPPPPPPEPPGFFESFLDSPLALLGGLGAIGGLIGFLVYKRRKDKGSGDPQHSVGPLTVTSASGAPSIFGTAGGRSVDTSASAIQTDFSQSGLSAIDTDEGVDPVAEADVYMAYGRDAQAEEILLDALKHDPDRNAIRLKLLEIYAQRKNMLQFETVAGELYARTGGLGAEWEKAASLGQMLDPNNPLYIRGPRDMGRDVGSEPEYVEEEDSVQEDQAPLSDTWTRSGVLDTAAAASQGADAYDRGGVSASPSPSAPPPVQDLDFDLGLEFQEGGASTEEQSGASFESTQWMDQHDPAPAEEEEHDHSFDSTIVLGAGGRGNADPFAGHDFHIDLEEELGQALPDSDAGVDFALDHVEPATAANVAPAMSEPHASPAMDEADEVLDFDLDGADAMSATARMPAVDLSDISLDLADESAPAAENLGAPDPDATQIRKFQAEATVARDAFHFDEQGMPVMDSLGVDEFEDDSPADVAAPQAAFEPLADLSGDETMDTFDLSGDMEDAPPAEEEGEIGESGTKLELAQAYEEMGDREGARDLLLEVVQEGTPDQQEKAKVLLARLG